MNSAPLITKLACDTKSPDDANREKHSSIVRDLC
jgi:hypothetical protein